MSFETLYSRVLKRNNQKYYLQKKEQYIEEIDPAQVIKDEVGNIIKKDAVGNLKEKWITLQELQGVVQHRQREDITEAGQESKTRYGRQGYYGYFIANFQLPIDKLANYRVKFQHNNETVYYRIMEYDPNNYLREKNHHIVLGLIEDKKYFGRQQ